MLLQQRTKKIMVLVALLPNQGRLQFEGRTAALQATTKHPVPQGNG